MNKVNQLWGEHMGHRQKFFVAIAGNIGTGKTTLTRLLSEQLGWDPHFEEVTHNPYLNDFYQDMARWSFPLQIYFLTHRFQVHQKINSEQKGALQDRSIYEDAHIFARNLYEQGKMEERDYQNYLELYQTLCHHLTPPDLMIYLKKSLPVLKQRITCRGRDFEKNLSDDYLCHLNKYYDDWMASYQLGRKLIIPSDHLDFLQNPKDLSELVQRILDDFHSYPTT